MSLRLLCKGNLKKMDTLEDWQPISTAPKDGTEILALYKNDGEYPIAWMEERT